MGMELPDRNRISAETQHSTEPITHKDLELTSMPRKHLIVEKNLQICFRQESESDPESPVILVAYNLRAS